MKKIVFSTSGSGGHTLPVKYIIDDLRSNHPDIDVYFIGSKNDSTASLVSPSVNDDNYHLISTGKYRRYATHSKIDKLLDYKTNYYNFVDFFRVINGLMSSYRLLRKIKPDLVFVKGGAVSLPVGLVANKLGIKFITHDSDTVAALSNKIVGKQAVVNMVGASYGKYPYDKSKIMPVGIPINPKLKAATKDEALKAKKALGFDPDKPLVYATGGSMGSVRLNELIASISDHLNSNGVQILHQVGKKHIEKYKDLATRERQICSFIEPKQIQQIYAAMDLIVCRGGASQTYEIAAVKKPMLMVPAPQLRDQVSNAKHLSDNGMVMIVDQTEATNDPDNFALNIEQSLNDNKQLKDYANNLHKLYNRNSAKEINQIIVNSL